CDNGTEFKNNDMNQFCGMKGIKRDFSVTETPQQNGVAERKNMTLIEAAKTILADLLLPTTFWAEAVNHNVADHLTKAFDVSSIRDKFGNKTGSCKVNAARQVKHIEYMVLNASLLKIPQSGGPPEKVGDEDVHKELGDRMERASTTASSLEAEQDSGNINRTQSMATLNEPNP
ncbi:putative ribonuclease H-like domain-containing protein, partial [Tanacetum coccineum]